MICKYHLQYNLVINEYSILEIFFFIIYEDILGITFIASKKKYFFLFYFLSYFIAFIAANIFEENIVLHFCNLDTNIRKNIIERAIEDKNSEIKNEAGIEISENYYVNFGDFGEKENEDIDDDSKIELRK